MKPLSIKVKITCWYTGLIIFILAVIMAGIVFGTDKVLVQGVQRELQDEVYDVAEDISYTNGSIDVNDVDFFDDGVLISLYTKEQTLFAGQLPAGLPAVVPFQSEQVQTVKVDGSQWLVYDLYITAKGQEGIWVRGAVSLSPAYETRNQILFVCMVLFPFLVLLAGYGGWLITQNAFQPVTLIQRTAAEIESSGDLSRRIHLTGSQDEIYQLAQTFDHMLDQLEMSFKAEQQFTADASHELRTPVTVMMTHAEYALAQKDNWQEAAEAIQVILQQAEKMNSLISALLLLARADHRTDNLEFEMINLSEVAEMVAEEMEIAARKRNITICADIEPDLTLMADQTSMMRLLLNLCQNAIRYGRDNGWVRLTLKRENDGIQGSVADNGIGIAPAEQEKIWKRFYQVDPARHKREDSGTGLGLPIVKWIVERHGGSIAIDSCLNGGTTVRFYLPVNRQSKL